MRVYEYDHTLPTLPVPELQDTCKNIKELTRPLVEPAAWETLCAELDSFLLADGAVLQQQLLQRAAALSGNASWLRPIWDDIYLSYRDRLPVNMNYVFKLISKRWGKQPLAALLNAMCNILNLLRTEALPPEKIRDNPLSMDALSHMIYTRIPDTFRDTLYFLPLAAPYTASVVCKGHWFILSLTDNSGNILPAASIQASLDQIRFDAAAMTAAVGVSSLTAARRAEAATLRHELQKNPQNRMNLESIENSICVVCLDDVDDKGLLHALLLGDPANRWFDKSLEIISDGQSLGVNIEHSGCDAGMWIYLLSIIDAHILEADDDRAVSADAAHIRPLSWKISSEFAAQIASAKQEYQDFVSQISVADRKLAGFSRTRLKSLKCRPDATAQILYQATYYKLTGRFRSTYEAVSVRNFYQGRTECMRPCTSAAADFARSLVDGTADKASLIEKFRTAEQAHMDQISNCQQGLGPERHISGLLAMQSINVNTQPLPAVFHTEAFKALKHDAISTSNTTAPYIEYFGFCPVVFDGIGIGYGMKNEALNIAVAAFADSTIKPLDFIDTLEDLANQFFALL